MRKTPKKLRKREVSGREAERALGLSYFEEIGEFVKLDLSREDRTLIPEVVFGESKSTEDLLKISERIYKKKSRVIITRLSKDQMKKLKKRFKKYRANELGRTFAVGKKAKKIGKIGILAAGTSDVPVAEEAKAIAEELGCEVYSSYDVGVAGIHRLFQSLKKILERKVKLIIAVAGMEGTLPGIIASLVDVPVIGVPTSTGYGLGEKGIGALTTMLQSCSPGLVVVNIDNGFGAAVAAVKILKGR